jgi:hypothetical protein
LTTDIFKYHDYNLCRIEVKNLNWLSLSGGGTQNSNIHGDKKA